MRADRLVSLVLLLRQRGRLTAGALAAELEVSTRTVLRDIEALSTAGVPVYAERGRHGGYALLPGFRTELLGLTHDETMALLAAGSQRGTRVLGLGPALASATRKVADALPEGSARTASVAAQRFLVDPEHDLLSRRTSDEIGEAVQEVRSAVLLGHRLRIRYASRDQPPRWRTVDPVGLVSVRDTGYLVATDAGEPRTYRLSRVHEAQVLAEPADRPPEVDLDRVWRDRCAQFLADGHLETAVRVGPGRRAGVLDRAVAVRSEEPDADGWTRLVVVYEDLWHAEWALWQAGPDVEALEPAELRAALRARAVAVADRHRD